MEIAKDEKIIDDDYFEPIFTESNKDIEIHDHNKNKNLIDKIDDQFVISDTIDKNKDNFIKYKFPPIELLKDPEIKKDNSYVSEIKKNAKSIEDTLKSFKINAKVTAVNRGPSVTCYELEPQGGVKVSSIVNLQDNLALSLASSGIRIEAPIPEKSVVGIEVPNKIKDFVAIKEILSSKAF